MKFQIEDLPYDNIYPEQYSDMVEPKRDLEAKGHACCLLEMSTGSGKNHGASASYTLPKPLKLIYCTGTVHEMEKTLEELKLISTLVFSTSPDCYSGSFTMSLIEIVYAQWFSLAGSVASNYGKPLMELVSVVPDGIVCFFVSYSYMDGIINNYKETGILKEIMQHKVVFIETQDVVEATCSWLTIAGLVIVGEVQFFFAVARYLYIAGKVAEGIDFDRHDGRLESSYLVFLSSAH
ncbi:hypothetical protein JCGZ_21942 [Jatropha curcas]|uniref:Helicase ATP-binding domain-containing protein n=1 Tax=Jatropha curcas TaxID=180498 RepID=A0A067JC98_JATCU|nr:hypothetical protein JCGZ_21942 [Jatropha curcas]